MLLVAPAATAFAGPLGGPSHPTGMGKGVCPSGVATGTPCGKNGKYGSGTTRTTTTADPGAGAVSHHPCAEPAKSPQPAT
jgi:hypothetical protein